MFSGLVDWIWKRKLIQTRLSQRPVYLGLAVGECPCSVFVPFSSMFRAGPTFSGNILNTGSPQDSIWDYSVFLNLFQFFFNRH